MLVHARQAIQILEDSLAFLVVLSATHAATLMQIFARNAVLIQTALFFMLQMAHVSQLALRRLILVETLNV